MTAAPVPLDLHEGIDTPPGSRCARWPVGLLLRSDDGHHVAGRCRATNLCEYCARLMAVETSELLLLDALEDAPGLYVVLTARELLERADCRRHLDKLKRSLRRRWPSIEWACLVEFQRRGALHLNLLVKGVPVEAAQALHEAVCRVWCARVDAEAAAQFVGPVSDGGGLVRYIALHFLKPEQAPPIGWRGHRISYTGGYLVRPARQLREEARSSLRLKRELWRARREFGDDALVVEEVAQARVAGARERSWRVVYLPTLWASRDSANNFGGHLNGGPSSPPAIHPRTGHGLRAPSRAGPGPAA